MTGPTSAETSASAARARGPARWLWFAAGWVSVGLGGVGVVVPGLPSTVFFVSAASCFARSSPRFERWVLDLPGVGQLVRDQRDGLGMPRRVKGWAIGVMWLFSGLGAYLSGNPVVMAVIVALALVGTWYIALRVPTREHVVAARSRASNAGA